MTTETALTLPERASAALGAKDYEIKLAALVASSARIEVLQFAADLLRGTTLEAA